MKERTLNLRSSGDIFSLGQNSCRAYFLTSVVLLRPSAASMNRSTGGRLCVMHDALCDITRQDVISTDMTWSVKAFTIKEHQARQALRDVKP